MTGGCEKRMLSPKQWFLGNITNTIIILININYIIIMMIIIIIMMMMMIRIIMQVSTFQPNNLG
jgi:hypothetical protein